MEHVQTYHRARIVELGELAEYFGAGDSLLYVLTYSGPGTMSETSFEYVSDPEGGWGTY